MSEMKTVLAKPIEKYMIACVMFSTDKLKAPTWLALLKKHFLGLSKPSMDLNLA